MIPSACLWERFATYDNFLLAWQRTVNVTSRMIRDELGMKSFAYNLQANLEDLIEQVQANDFPYEPLADHKVYVPKPSSTLRTMSLLAVPDSIVYQAFVNVIADCCHPQLVSHENQHVWGNLYGGSNSRWMLRPWKQQYEGYVNYIEKLYHSKNTWIASTDIVSFYDTIDHKRLANLVRKYCGRDEIFEEKFYQCLGTWSAHNGSISMGRGIPQGSNASDFLANLFLYEIDKSIIASGYHYVRYVDDVRILASDKTTVQRGLILFDLELKRAGLVAQITKTSVHQIEDIKKEVLRLRFTITDQTGDDHIYEASAGPNSEQAESVADYIKNSSGETADIQVEEITNLEIENQNFQLSLREKFLENYMLLDDLDRGREAESYLTYCLNRLEAHESIRAPILSLLSKLPWRSEAITRCLGRFISDTYVAEYLKDFINHHDLYSWHRANSLMALSKVSSAKSVASICRVWLSESKLDWYARTIATRILVEAPGQHAFFIECLQREQEGIRNNPEETAILRQELAYGAFRQAKSKQKHMALFRLICTDKSRLLHHLAIYILQQPTCKVTWDDLNSYHQQIGALSGLVMKLGLSTTVPNQCFVSQTLIKMYEVSLSIENLRNCYHNHYDKAVEKLRESVNHYHTSPSDYIRTFHQFAHITFVALYEHVFPTEGGIYEGYAHLVDRKIFIQSMPNGHAVWRKLGSMRNRVDHPVDSKTKSHSQKITVAEVEMFKKEIKVALQEMFEFWLKLPSATTPIVFVTVT